MQETALQYESTTRRKSRRTRRSKAVAKPVGVVLSVKKMRSLIEEWLLDGEGSSHSPNTISLRRTLTSQLLWFLDHINAKQCSAREMKQFMAYLNKPQPDGRWGKDGPHAKTALRPSTIHSYYTHIRTFFNWAVDEEIISESPMNNVKRPIKRSDQIQPFSDEQLKSLLQAARDSCYSQRDEVILRFLLDTGVRVTELCTLTLKDINISDRSAYVMGKGSKRRTVPFCSKTAKALQKYLREDDRAPCDPVFLSERGRTADAQFTRSGVFQLIERLGKKAISTTYVAAHILLGILSRWLTSAWEEHPLL